MIAMIWIIGARERESFNNKSFYSRLNLFHEKKMSLMTI